MEQRAVHIPGISCGHCIKTIQREVGNLQGIQSVEGDEKTKMITVKWSDPASWEEIAEPLQEIGYPA